MQHTDNKVYKIRFDNSDWIQLAYDITGGLKRATFVLLERRGIL
jgi:hypothetical protein